MKTFVWNLPELFYHLFIWNWLCLLGLLVFDSGIFDLACGWFCCLLNSRVGIVPSTVPVSFILWVREIPIAELGLLEGKIPAVELGRVCFRVRNFIYGAAKPELWKEEILAAETGLRVGEIHTGVTWMYVGEPLLMPSSGRNPISGCIELGSVVVVRCTHKHAM